MVALAVRYLSVAAAFQLVDAAQAVAQGALRGSGYALADDDRAAGLLAAGLWYGGGAGLTTPLRGMGVWIGLAIGLRWWPRCC
jgi:MATE family multidrug resistance protein